MSSTQFGGSAAFSGGGFMPPPATPTADPSFHSSKNRDVQTLLPLTVKQINDALVSGNDKLEFVIDGVYLSNITLVGMVRDKIGRITDVAFILDDGTGRMNCHRWFEEATDAYEAEKISYGFFLPNQLHLFPTGMYVRVTGHLKRFQGKKTLDVFSTWPVSDYNEIAKHFHSCIDCHVSNSRLPKPHVDAGVTTQPHMTIRTNQFSGQYSFDGQSILELLCQPSYLEREEGAARVDDIARQLKIPVSS